MNRKYALIAALIIGAGCKSTEEPDPLVTTTVTVSIIPTQIAINETAQASATIKDQNGDALSGKTVAWTSLNPTVATVNPTTGQIKGVAAGNATIRGQVDDVTGSATVTVIQPSQVCANGPTNVDLPVGQVRVVNSGDAKGCIRIVSTSSTSEYLVIAANTNPLNDQRNTFTFKSDEGETVPSTNLLANPYHVASQVVAQSSANLGTLQVSFETKLRAQERRELDFARGRHAYALRAADKGIRYSTSAAIPAVGEKTNFKVPAKFDASGNSLGGNCTNFTQVTATVKHVSTRAIVYVDDASPGGGFTDVDFQDIAAEFDNLIYPTDVEYFGTPLDQDANSRIVILYTPLVNKLTPANQSGFVGGFFFTGDLFPTSQCSQSNVAEIFYLLAPDPSGTINNNIRTTTSVRQGTRGTIAHEFQHMINASERFRSPVTEEFESTWLDEGLAHFAEDLNGRVLRQFNETGNYNDSQIRVNNNDYNAFFFQNFARFRLYLANPPLNSPTDSLQELADRGAAWSLVRYSADHYAPGGDVKAFIKSLIPGPDTGVVNLRTKASNTPFDTLAAGWMVANFADDLGITNLPVKYTYKTYNMRDAASKATNNAPGYPLNPTNITGSGFVASNITVQSGSGAYFFFSRAPGAPARSFRFMNTDLATAAAFVGANFIVLRSQ